jgi:Domain of unknown function (DUF6249)
MKNLLKTIIAAVCLAALAAAPLRAQTNAEGVSTNTAITNAAAPVAAANPKKAEVPDINIDGTGVHINGGDDDKVPFIATLSATLALLIPIVGIVMGCAVPIAIVALVFYYRHRKNMMLHETVRAMVDKGVPIPTEMFKTADNSSKRPRNDFRTGLILIGIGSGLVFLRTHGAGLIVLFLGAAFLIASFFDKKNRNDEQPPKT